MISLLERVKLLQWLKWVEEDNVDVREDLFRYRPTFTGITSWMYESTPMTFTLFTYR